MDKSRFRHIAFAFVAAAAWGAVAAAACRGTEQVPPAASTPSAAPAKNADKDAFLRDCAVSCEKRNAMRAVGAQMIRAECERDCEKEWDERLLDPK